MLPDRVLIIEFPLVLTRAHNRTRTWKQLMHRPANNAGHAVGDIAPSERDATGKCHGQHRSLNYLYDHALGGFYCGRCHILRAGTWPGSKAVSMGRGISHRICAAQCCVHHSRQPCRLGKYEAKNQIDSPIKIGQKISANRHTQGLTSARRKAPISTPIQNK